MKLINRKDCWIFDMDGTLTNAVHDFKAIKKELGTPEEIDILDAISQMPENLANTTYIRLQEIEYKLASIGTASPGTIDLLNHLELNKHKLGILTLNSLVNTIETLRAASMSSFFQEHTIIAREHCEPKPSPIGIQILLGRFSANPNKSVMIGDYIYDLQAGREAGITTIYIDPTGKFIFKEMADYCVTRLDEIFHLE